MGLGLSVGIPLGRSRIVGSIPAALYWMDPDFDRRFTITATNPSSTVALNDHVFTAAVPTGVTIDADSFRVVETAGRGGIDNTYGHRYQSGLSYRNRMRFTPASLTGSTISIKALGKWNASETRSFAVYWDSTSVVAALPTYPHLDSVSNSWTATFIAGATGNSYVIVVGGATYTHVMTAGQTATQIAQAMLALINAGAVATATGAAAVLTIKAVDPGLMTFTVANTGTTTPANLAIVKPNYILITRTGPDINLWPSTYAPFGLPFHNPNTLAMTRPGWGRSAQLLVRAMNYNVNGVGSQTLTGGTVSALTVNKDSLTATGNLTFPIRSGAVDWTGAYTAAYRHIIYTGRKSDETGAGTFLKWVDAMKVTLTYTCVRGYTPAAVAASATTLGGHEVISLASLEDSFSGNNTESAGNKIAHFSAPLSTGAITAYTAASNLSSLPVVGTIIGTHGNTNGWGLLVNSISLTNFGDQAPEAKWVTDSNEHGYIHLRNLVTNFDIPIGATIAIDFWLVSGYTNAASSVGDNFLPDEVVSMIRSVTYAPTLVVGGVTPYTTASLPATILDSALDAITGQQWFVSNAAAKAGGAWNHAYSHNLLTGISVVCDDDDSAYGHSHLLHGLCLRYLRTKDALIIPMLEQAVQYQIDIEQAAVTAYGSWYNGSAPYWYAPAVVTKILQEGGVSNGDVDPGMPGGVFGTITYNPGEVRRLTSIDQIHMKAHALYAYLYLLRNETAITANTTLWNNAKSLVSRMATFEAAHFGASDRVCGNLNNIVNGIIPTNRNGVTATEFNDVIGSLISAVGTDFISWQINDVASLTVGTGSNIAVDTFFRAVFAPGSVPSGVTLYMKKLTDSMVASDLSNHDVGGTALFTHYDSAGVISQQYPDGWMMRGTGTVGNEYRFTSGRAGDDHYINLAAGGAFDMLAGRVPQRLIVLCLTAMLDPNYVVPVEMAGGVTVLRSTPIRTVIDEVASAMALYGTESTTRTRKYSDVGFMGGGNSNVDPKRVDSAFVGYWMMATELWHLVNAGANYTTYYPIGLW